jgi:uncharacterized protein YdaU (DUF1376 family)
MSTKRPPAFQMYAADFLADANVAVMTAEEVGAYLLLMLYAWREDGMRNDIEELAGLARIPFDRFRVSWDKRIARCFKERDDGRLVHPRLEQERNKQIEFRRRAADAGRLGGRPSKGLEKGTLSTGKGEAIEEEALQSSSSSSLLNTGTTIEPRGWLTTFVAQWEAATNGVAPSDVIRLALKPLVDRDGVETVQAAWERFVRSRDCRFGPKHFAGHYGEYRYGGPLAATAAMGRIEV